MCFLPKLLNIQFSMYSVKTEAKYVATEKSIC